MGGRLLIAILLLDTQAVDVDARDIFGRSPIFWAARKGQEDIVRLLLERNATHDFVDEDGQTPLSIAKKKGYKNVVDLSIAKGIREQSLSELVQEHAACRSDIPIAYGC